jgi:hypothetical protein
MEGMT